MPQKLHSTQRSHYNWKNHLEAHASTGNIKAQKIIDESVNPGEYFDGLTHLTDVVYTLIDLKKDEDVKAIGIFGSRLVKNHTTLVSDTDIFVIHDGYIGEWSPTRGYKDMRKTFRYIGIADGINIQECSTKNWRKFLEDPESLSRQTREVMRSVRWLWIREGYKDHLAHQ